MKVHYQALVAFTYFNETELLMYQALAYVSLIRRNLVYAGN